MDLTQAWRTVAESLMSEIEALKKENLRLRGENAQLSLDVAEAKRDICRLNDEASLAESASRILMRENKELRDRIT